MCRFAFAAKSIRNEPRAVEVEKGESLIEAYESQLREMKTMMLSESERSTNQKDKLLDKLKTKEQSAKE